MAVCTWMDDRLLDIVYDSGIATFVAVVGWEMTSPSSPDVRMQGKVSLALHRLRPRVFYEGSL